MRRFLVATALGIAGILFALGMTVGASALVARDLGDPVTVIRVSEPRQPGSAPAVDEGSPGPSPTATSRDGAGSDDRSGSGGAAEDRSGPGGGDDRSAGSETEGPDDSSGRGSGSDDSSGSGSGDEAHDD
ncbi:MAG TPA: hypothetical protein VNO79_15135 [Actinomycetota bacterium]|nr:hypothetical protein [Actinomycetota bacterium]